MPNFTANGKLFLCNKYLWPVEIIPDGPLVETKYCAIGIEFQERGSPHVCLFIWIFSVPNIQNEDTYIEFIEKTINVQMLQSFSYYFILFFLMF